MMNQLGFNQVKEAFECPICFEHYYVDDGRIACANLDENNTTITNQHGICIDCMRNHAKAAVDDVPLVKGGIGLKCVIPDCKNVLLMSEFGMYLEDDIHTALMNRMQHESIVTAEMSDLVTCPNCSRQFAVGFGFFYECLCGRKQCRYCPRPYDDYHSDKACEELDELERKQKLEHEIAPKLSEAVVRVCPRCKLQFMKQDGCNKIQCRCGARICYLCNIIVNDYSHFCQCGSKIVGQQCPKCHKKCPLYHDDKIDDNERINRVKAESGL